MSVGVDIRDDVTGVLKSFWTGLQPDRLAPAIGAAVVLLFQNHFLALPPNKQNWPSTGFWQAAARSCNYSILADGVDINVSKQGVRQRLEGGEISAGQNSAWLTIPARQEAYGKRAGEFSNLVFEMIHGRSGNLYPALVEGTSQDVSFGRKRKDGSRKVTPGAERGGLVMFWLKKSVHQDANPNVIPGEPQIRETCRTTVHGIVNRLQQRGGAA